MDNQQNDADLSGTLSIDLLACPFCGCKDCELITPNNISYRFIACPQCLAQGPNTVNGDVAIELWNKRAANDLHHLDETKTTTGD